MGNMKNIKPIAIFLATFGLSFGLFTGSALAMTPTISYSQVNNSYVQATVYGDSNSSVNFYYYNSINSSSVNSLGTIGTTNSNGYLSTTIPSGYTIPAGVLTYVIVNNQQSPSVAFPYYSGTGYGGQISLSQNNIYMNPNQTATVSVEGGSGNYFVSSNSNSGIVTTTITGNNINLYSDTSGIATLTICSNGSNYSCGTLTVNVGYTNGMGNPSTPALSETYVNVNAGQTQTISVNAIGNVYLSNILNPNIATAVLNGTIINVTGISAGATSVSVCSSGVTNGCTILYINVSGSIAGGIVYVNPTYPTGGQLSSGVFLSQVPYTGASLDLKMILFLLGMFIWSAFAAYFIIGSSKKNLVLSSNNDDVSDRIQKFKLENLRNKKI